MVELTGKQKRNLRGRGQKLPVAIHVGKAGLTPAVATAAGKLLSERELIKVRLPAGPSAVRSATAEQLARDVEACCVSVLGRTALLYRPNEALPPDRRMDLPPAADSDG